MNKVLLVDDEIEILRDTSRLIMELGFECLVAQNGNDALRLLKQEHPDIILTDQKMPVMGGMALLEEVRLHDKTIPVILFTGYGTIDTAVSAMKLGAFDYLQKPFPPAKIAALLQKAINYRKENYDKSADNDTLAKRIDLQGVIGKSKVIEEITDKIIKVAPSNSNILIFGESGTGKELIARNLHLYSKRKTEPFIPVDCTALPSNLLESELFGYEKGAFTGANRIKPGVIELADKGTLFLDEITEMDHNLQSKLLRFLQERQFRRLGGQKLLEVDVRIISATNRDPEQAVKEQKLRQDLYFRLNVVPVFISPLRERREDIPLLVRHFIKKYNPSFSREIKGISSDAMFCLKKYHWPGNVRELQNIIEQMMSLAENNVIDIADIPKQIRETSNTSIEQAGNNSNFKEAKERFLKQFGKKYFEELLVRCNGNLSQTARMAGISRSSLYRIFEEFDIKIPD
ncbi:MAG TPA: sigma-54 dependent transcriptional regulator [bacterium]|nr:sigma-54 dependent transcriptional regulator [bacterium]HPN45150.1 sigma-54 dependent transcriptional regulator [bacterium]